MSLLGELTYALISSPVRSIGTVIPDVVIEEAHRDELIITQHPVEKGATITDHAFARPAELDMRCGFSDSSAAYAGYTQDVYQALRALQQSRRPFTVTTGKRVYRNMLIRALGVITDARSENALMVLCGLQEIKIVSTQTTSTGSDTAGAGQSGDQASPQTTGGTTNGGDQQGLPITGSELAGSFNPGGFNTDGGSLGNGSFGSLGTPGMDGLSSGPTAELGELQIDGIDNDNRPQGVEASPYNVFGS